MLQPTPSSTPQRREPWVRADLLFLKDSLAPWVRFGRGYEVAKGQYLIVEHEELEAIEIESTHVIEIDSLVPRQQIEVIREAMRLVRGPIS
jgi:hypothetical protein